MLLCPYLNEELDYQLDFHFYGQKSAHDSASIYTLIAQML